MVHLKSIWESMNGPSEIDLRVELESIRIFWVHFGPSGVNFRVHFGSMLKSDSDFGFRSPRDQISKALGPILAPLLDPMLALVGSMLEAVGRFGAS